MRARVIAVSVCLGAMLVLGIAPAFADIYGTPDDDTITGTAHHNWIEGLGGDDVILGLEGDDYLFVPKGKRSTLRTKRP